MKELDGYAEDLLTQTPYTSVGISGRSMYFLGGQINFYKIVRTPKRNCVVFVEWINMRNNFVCNTHCVIVIHIVLQ